MELVRQAFGALGVADTEAAALYRQPLDVNVAPRQHLEPHYCPTFLHSSQLG